MSLLDILRSPDAFFALTPGEQSMVVRQARFAALLGHLDAELDETDIPQKLADQFLSARIHADFYHAQITWEIQCLSEVLGDMPGPVILLKGAAYKALELEFARGRLASDVDLLIPRQQLQEAEERLTEAGWEPIAEDEYEQHYYRKWMHELPPLRHEDRGTIVDLHHSILAPTARLGVDISKMLEGAVPLPGSKLFTLREEDAILHRCTHLFYDGEMNNCIRELVDIRGLLDHFCESQPVEDLLARADDLGLQRPLGHALHFCSELLESAPARQAQSLSQEQVSPLLSLTRSLMHTQLRPKDLDHERLSHKISGALLFMRSHWLRMPMPLLVRHLARQAWTRGGLKAGH